MFSRFHGVRYLPGVILGMVAVITFPGCDAQKPAAQASAAAADASADPAARQFAVEGMSCQGCVDSVTEALTEIPGVRSVSVSLEKKTAYVVADPPAVPDEKIVAAITKAGYEGRAAEKKAGKG